MTLFRRMAIVDSSRPIMSRQWLVSRATVVVLLLLVTLSVRAGEAQPLIVDGGVFDAEEARFSSGGRYAVLRSGNRITLWDTKEQSTVTAFSLPSGSKLLAISSDAKLAAILHHESEPTVRLWNIRLGRAMHDIARGESWYAHAAFSPGGDLVALAHSDNIHVVDVRNGRTLRRLGSSCTVQAVQERLRGMSYHPGPQDGTFGPQTAAAIEEFQARRGLKRDGRLTDVVCRELGLSPLAHGAPITSLAFTPDGGSIVTAAYRGDSDYAYGSSIVVWRWLDGSVTSRFGSFEEAPEGIVVSPDGCTVFVAGRTIRAFAVDGGRELAVYAVDGEVEWRGPQPAVFEVSRDGRRVLLSDRARQRIVLWEWQQNSDPTTVDIDRGLLAAAFGGAGERRILVCSTRGGVREYDIDKGRIVRSPEHVLQILSAMEFSPDGRYLAVGTWGGAYVWDLSTGVVVPTDKVVGRGTLWEAFWGGGLYLFDDLRITNEGTLVGANVKGVVGRWTLATGDFDGSFAATGAENRIQLDFGGGTLAVATGAGGVTIRDLRTGTVSATLVPDEPVKAAALTPNGDVIAIGTSNGAIRLLDRRTGDDIATLVADCYEARCSNRQGVREVTGLRFSRSGNLLLSFHNDRSPQVWHVPGRRRIRSFPYRQSPSSDAAAGTFEYYSFSEVAALSPDDTHIVVGYSNGEVAVADIESGRERYRTAIRNATVWNVAWSPDGRHILTTTSDHILRVWDALTGREKTTLRVFEGDEWLFVSADGRFNGTRRALKALRVSSDGIYRRIGDDAAARRTAEPFRLADTQAADTKGPIPIAGSPREQPRQLGSYRRKYAVVIGVAKYARLRDRPAKGELANLRFADRDAREFDAFLRDARMSGGGWEIITLLNEQATARAVDDALTTVLTKAEEDDFVMIFFSGHGRAHHIRPQDVYLLTHDFNPGDARSGYSYTVLQQMIADTKAQHVVAFVDACRSGAIGFADKAGAATGQFSQDVFERLQLQSPPNRLIFSSGRDTQGSNEDPKARMGVFTHYLLRGLKGDAPDRKNPHFVDLGELRDYVKDAVVDHCRKNDWPVQVPELWEKHGLTYEDFPLAIRR